MRRQLHPRRDRRGTTHGCSIALRKLRSRSLAVLRAAFARARRGGRVNPLLRLMTATLVVTAFVQITSHSIAGQTTNRSSRYEDLVSLFGEWRAFQKPKLVNGVPDY